MPLNFQQVYEKIREIGQGAQARQATLDALRKHALHLLDAWADKGQALGDKVERARQADPFLRCAIPLAERLDASLDPGPAVQSPVTLLAADGSQITPDRHAALLFGLINVGAIVFPGGAKAAPLVFTDSSLSYAEEVADWTDGLVALRRDLAERRMLLDLSKDHPAPVVTLTDGPLQLWESHESDAVFGYEKALAEYLDVLSQLQKRDVTTAGYVDKPSSNLLVRLLDVAATPENELKDIHDKQVLPGVTDRWLFEQILRPQTRSAVFALQARSRAVYKDSLALHFFYLNVGSKGHPVVVRVEIPRWVAEDAAKLDRLCSILLQQCEVMGAKPYPYILHRAHEVAVVKLEEKQQIAQMLELELRRAGGEVDEKSGKQSAKDLPGRGKR
jgi:hypothetical protein